MMVRNYAVLMILFYSISLSSAAIFSPNDIEWASSAVSGTLYKGDSLTNGIYTVKAVQFPAGVPGVQDINGNIVPETNVDPSVLLEIYKNGVLLKDVIMTPLSEPYIDPDYEVKVSTTGFMSSSAKEWVLEFYKPWATISIQLRAKPKLEVSISTDKTTYTSYDDNIITATVTVKNTGEAFIKNVDLNLDIGELKLRGGDESQLHRNYYRIDKGGSQSFDVILLVPGLLDQKSYGFKADSKGYDVKDAEYKATTEGSVTVSPKQNYFTVSKSVFTRMYLQNSATVRVTISNGGMYDIHDIRINDSMNENFELKTNTPLQWNVSLLRPYESQEFTYSIRPLEASLTGFTIPAASAAFTVNNKQYTATSKTINMVVNGPKIMVNKTVNRSVVNISEDVTVSVTIRNIGDIATKTEVKDSLPDNVFLISGSTSLASTFLELNTPQGFSYIIRMNNEGVFELPAAVANYTGVEYRGLVRAARSSERPVITVIDPSKITPTPTPTPASGPAQGSPTSTPTPTVTPTPTPITPGFGYVLATSMLIFAAYLRRR